MSYKGYFGHRNVSAEYYKDYRVPAYMTGVLPRDINARILDIGCGFGHLPRALQETGYVHVEGVDISEDAVAHCVKNGLKVSHIEDLERYCSEQPEPVFNLVIMSHVLEHIEKHRIVPTLNGIREKLLIAGGSFLVMVPNAQSNTGCYWAYEDFTHTTLFTTGSLLFVLKAAGFNDIRFLDPDGLEGVSPLVQLPKRLLLRYYSAKIHFWNLVTNSSFHHPSPRIFTYELKALAR